MSSLSGIACKRCTGLLKLYVLKQGIIIQQGSYEELVAVDGYFKDLVASGLGQFSSAIEEELKAGKYSTAQPYSCYG